MKNIKKYLLIVCLFASIYSCKKDDPSSFAMIPTGKDTLRILSTKWKIIKDSGSSINYTFPWGWIPIPGVYYGTTDDFYLFDSSYNISVHENGHDFIKGTYKLLPDSQILIDTTEPRYIGNIKTLNDVNATFEWPLTSPNGGTYLSA